MPVPMCIPMAMCTWIEWPMELDQLCARLITLLADLEATRGLVKLEAREAHLQTASTHIGSHGDGHGGGDREGVQGHAHGECA